jgi:septum formation protein
MNPQLKLVLASSSPYRKQQLLTLGLDFICARPDIDETSRDQESAMALAVRLAAEKAQAVATQYPDALIIASDQTLALGDQILGKPETFEKAATQLRLLCGQAVTFYSALTLLNTRTHQLDTVTVETQVRYRTLSDAQIHRYLLRDNPVDCAGSFKVEALGIAILASVSSSDPSALIGLPLISLCTLLTAAGVDVI